MGRRTARHIIMVGEPGTGKSMLSRSMTEFLPKEQLGYSRLS